MQPCCSWLLRGGRATDSAVSMSSDRELSESPCTNFDRATDIVHHVVQYCDVLCCTAHRLHTINCIFNRERQTADMRSQFPIRYDISYRSDISVYLGTDTQNYRCSNHICGPRAARTSHAVTSSNPFLVRQ